MKTNLKKILLALSITVLLGSLSMNAGMLGDAVDTDDLEKVKTVFEDHNNNIDIDAITSGFCSTALHQAAARTQKLEIVKYLVEHGADINLKNILDITALEWTNNKKIKAYLTHVKNYFDNLIVVTEKDLVNGNPIDPITIPNYNTLNLLPLVAKKKMQISLFKNERIKKEFHNTHFLYL